MLLHAGRHVSGEIRQQDAVVRQQLPARRLVRRRVRSDPVGVGNVDLELVGADLDVVERLVEATAAAAVVGAVVVGPRRTAERTLQRGMQYLFKSNQIRIIYF